MSRFIVEDYYTSKNRETMPVKVNGQKNGGK